MISLPSGDFDAHTHSLSGGCVTHSLVLPFSFFGSATVAGGYCFVVYPFMVYGLWKKKKESENMQKNKERT